MKKSLKSLLAIAASSATTLALATPSYAVQLDVSAEETFTGVFQAELESTRSCTINSIGVDNQGGFLSDQIGGTAIALKRKPTSDNAVGSIAIEFETLGANTVYFEEGSFKVGALDTNNQLVPPEVNGIDAQGKITVTLEERQEALTDEAREKLLDQLTATGGVTSTPNADSNKVAEISNIDSFNNKGGYVLGGQGRNEDPNAAQEVGSLAELANVFNRPTTRQAFVTMAIKDVDALGTSAIQAKLVCAPVIIEDDANRDPIIRPMIN